MEDRQLQLPAGPGKGGEQTAVALPVLRVSQ